MGEVIVHATGQQFDATGTLLEYYQGEANTVGGYTIDGVEYPVRIDVPADDAEAEVAFDPNDHTVAEVREHLAASTPAEVERVLEAERAGKARVTLLRDYELPEVEQLPEGQFDDSLNVERTHPGFGEPMHGVEAPTDGSGVDFGAGGAVVEVPATGETMVGVLRDPEPDGSQDDDSSD